MNKLKNIYILFVALLRNQNKIRINSIKTQQFNSSNSIKSTNRIMPRHKHVSVVKNFNNIETKKDQKTVAENSSIFSESLLAKKSATNLSPNSLDKFKFEKKQHIKVEFEKDTNKVEGIQGLWEPPKWKEFLVNLQTMRANNDAPVDLMGCHMCMDENASPKVIRYQSLISLMLSSQTKDQVTFAAMQRLKARGLNIDNILNMSDEELGKLIYPVGFWKTKVKYIKKTTQTLKDQYNCDIPDSAEKLCKLTGVGPKMAHICMKVAWNKITGIGVDTHVHRISNRIGWVKKPTSTPEDTRKALQTWLPFDLWSDVNHLMVGFGQTICLPVGPTCHECLNRDICPSSGLGKKSPNKRSPKKVKEEINIETLDVSNSSKKSPRETKTLPLKFPTSMNNAISCAGEIKPESFVNDKKITKRTPSKRINVENKNSIAGATTDYILDCKATSAKRKSPRNTTNQTIHKILRKKKE